MSLEDTFDNSATDINIDRSANSQPRVRKTKRIIFWVIYIIVALGISLPLLITGGIWINSIHFHMIQDGPPPSDNNGTICLVTCDYYEDSICGIYPPIWLILCGCTYAIGFALAVYPLYVVICFGITSLKKECILVVVLSVKFLGILNLLWAFFGMAKPNELFNTGLPCVKNMARVILGYTILNFIVVGGIVIGGIILFLMYFCLPYEKVVLWQLS